MACNLYAELFHLIHGKPALPLNFWAAACALQRAKTAGWGEASLENKSFVSFEAELGRTHRSSRIFSGPRSQAIAHWFLLVDWLVLTRTPVQLLSSR